MKIFALKILAVEEPDADDYFECSDEQKSEEADSESLDELPTDSKDNLISSSEWTWEMPTEERWIQLHLLEEKFWKLVMCT